ncbi:hypothetical protein EDC44_12813 [Cricetibacter osteomyelitidis]|uniref:CdiI C-terminal domain-containing protein n=1 Tax=Cricetibacter osteomyelitidis TaxID=1521931 RepID=A0A4R2SRV9_9PAST|nr:hypothetical protein [Cricetibacter osteomyelitidis]TCP92060.1 hypothetical protein EDC44_12813 [Cricetibacter osteomyelitidis]
MFDIVFKSPPVMTEFGLNIPTRIFINDFQEDFLIPIGFWDEKDYLKSWINSLINRKKENKAILLVSAELEPNFIFSWILYFEKNNVFIQNKILFPDEYDNFTLENINTFIPNRNLFNEEGKKISEWSVDIQSIDEFYTKIKKHLDNINKN